MVTSDIMGRSFANGLVFVANMLNTVTIDKLVVPDLVQAGLAALLTCQYSVLDDRYTLQWLFNGSEVYAWRPGMRPNISGMLKERLDLDFKDSNASIHEGHTLRIVQTAAELSGEYTCRVRADSGADANQTATMLIYSSESEFLVDVQHNSDNMLDIKCSARGLYPQPELIIEFDQSPVAQLQRVWRAGALYSAESSARVRVRRGRAVCRLLLPAAGYEAMRSYCIPANDTGSVQSSSPHRFNSFNIYTLLVIVTLVAKTHVSI